MSIFDQILTSVASHFADSEKGSALFKLVIELINKPEIGGISGLVILFQEKGLDGIISSWIGTGENLPISSEQIKQVLGSETLDKISSNTSLPVQNISSDLAQLLPKVIDLLTPNGQVPDANNLLEQGLDFLKDKLVGGDANKTA